MFSSCFTRIYWSTGLVTCLVDQLTCSKLFESAISPTRICLVYGHSLSPDQAFSPLCWSQDVTSYVHCWGPSCVVGCIPYLQPRFAVRKGELLALMTDPVPSNWSNAANTQADDPTQAGEQLGWSLQCLKWLLVSWRLCLLDSFKKCKCPLSLVDEVIVAIWSKNRPTLWKTTTAVHKQST